MGHSFFLAAEPTLVLDAAGLRPVSLGHPEQCPSCGALLGHPGPGLRRCAHCEFERCDAPPARSSALGAATKALRVVRGGGAATPVSRRELFRGFRRREEPRLARVARWSGLGFLVAILCAIPVDLLSLDVDGRLTSLQKVLLSVGLLPGTAGAIGLAWAGYRWLRLRFTRFRPGMLAYGKALREEILRVVAHQGQIGLDDLAEHLDGARRHLEGVLAHLGRSRRVPLYHDQTGDRLVSAGAHDARDSRCPACGGRRGVGAASEMVCERCGGRTGSPR